MAVLGYGFWAYGIVSAVLAVLVVQHAIVTREQFYPTVVYLTTSKFSIVVLTNLFFVLVVSLAKTLKAIFLGALSLKEVEVSPPPGNAIWSALRRK